jgi:hypothetical protein
LGELVVVQDHVAQRRLLQILPTEEVVASQHIGIAPVEAYHRRMCARMDKPKAVTAAAHKLVRPIYAMLRPRSGIHRPGQDYFEKRYRQRVLHNLAQRAKAMGMQLAPCGNTH